MKKSVWFVSAFSICFCLSARAQTTTLEQFIDKYKSKNEVFHLSMPGWAFRMAARMAADTKEEKLELQSIAKGIGHVRLLVFNDTAEPPLAEDVNGLISGAHKANFQDLAFVQQGKQKVQLLIREDKNRVSDLLLMVAGKEREGNNSLLISISGSFSIDDVNRWLAKTKIGKEP